MSPNTTTKPPCGLPLWPRGLASILLLVFAQVFHIVSVTTPLINLKRDIVIPVPTPNGTVTVTAYNEVTVGVMKSRIFVDASLDALDQDTVLNTKDLPNTCDTVHQMTDALRAMFFTSLGLCAFCLLAAIANALALIPSAVVSILLMLTIPIGAIGGLIAFLIWEKEQCPGVEAWTDREGAKIGTATPFLIVAVILEKIALILTCALPKGPHDWCSCVFFLLKKKCELCFCFSEKSVDASEPIEKAMTPRQLGAPAGALREGTVVPVTKSLEM